MLNISLWKNDRCRLLAMDMDPFGAWSVAGDEKSKSNTAYDGTEGAAIHQGYVRGLRWCIRGQVDLCAGHYKTALKHCRPKTAPDQSPNYSSPNSKERIWSKRLLQRQLWPFAIEWASDFAFFFLTRWRSHTRRIFELWNL